MNVPLLVSPAVIAFVGLVQGHDEVGRAIEVIADLNQLLSDYDCISLVADETFNEALYGSDAFPFHQTLGPLLNSSGWSHVYDPGLILVLITALIERMRGISELTTADDLLVAAVEIDPAQVQLNGYPSLVDCLNRTLAFYCSAVVEARSWPSIAALFADATAPAAADLEIDCDVELVEPPIVPGAEGFSTHARIAQFQSRRDLYTRIDPEMLWRAAEVDCDLKLAIATRAFQMQVGTGAAVSPDDLSSFTIGQHFRGSLDGAQSARSAPYAMNTLESCARVVAGLPQPDNNPFLTAASSGVQRTRDIDGAKAFRVHVSKGGIAVRLMYWRRDDGHVEFSNAAPKDQTVIYE